MALESAGFPSGDGLTSHAAARRDLEGTVVRDSAGKMRAGVFYNHPDPLFARTATMKLNIPEFRAVQDKQGACFIAGVGTTETPAFGAAPAANKRIDLLYLTQELAAIDGTNEIKFGIVAGTPSPTPVAPSLPAHLSDAIPWVDVEIPAGATSMQSAGVIITPRYPYTAMAGGTVVVRNLVELAAWTPANSARAHCLSDNGDYVRSGDQWALDGGAIVGLVAAGGTIGANWIAGTGPNAPRIAREGNKRTLYGSVLHTPGGNLSAILTVPPADRPPTASERTIGLAPYRPSAASGALISSIFLSAGTIGNKSITASAPNGYTYDLAGLTWWMD